MKVTQISIGRFHHFHLARQMERFGLLDKVFTGYPKFKLKDEKGIDINKIKTFPYLHAPYMKRNVIGLDKYDWLNKAWVWYDKLLVDSYAASKIDKPTILIALSGTGLKAGKVAKKKGGIYICDRGSTHIQFQDEILREEYEKWGFVYKGIDPRIIDKELEEYNFADKITIPSTFAKNSYIDKGINENKITKIPYGINLSRFQKTKITPIDVFRVIWVGGVSLRKGFMYALKAFQRLEHPNKEFLIIGSVSKEIKFLLTNENLDKIIFKGNVSNAVLKDYYSVSHVFVMPSIEDGFGMVLGESLACGCPIITTTNSGGVDLFDDSKEGFIVPIRSSDDILEKMQFLADNPEIQKRMSSNAEKKAKGIGGWDSYGDSWKLVIDNYNKLN
ncbi:glycosyltransferase family 4 protein [Polaribacter sp. Asnod6-C07]|uniref:glycosyltransferase family 4 protein n=1 Tax=Polaribacter sp. Asnod6-C07 TaxID=3160582 RepID=UPI003867F69F